MGTFTDRLLPRIHPEVLWNSFFGLAARKTAESAKIFAANPLRSSVVQLYGDWRQGSF